MLSQSSILAGITTIRDIARNVYKLALFTARGAFLRRRFRLEGIPAIRTLPIAHFFLPC